MGEGPVRGLELRDTNDYVKLKVKLLSCVQLFVTPWTVAYQDSLSMGFSRQGYWVGCHFLIQAFWTENLANSHPAPHEQGDLRLSFTTAS